MRANLTISLIALSIKISYIFSAIRGVLMVKVLSVGGSIVAPSEPDIDFLKSFSVMARGWLSSDASNKLILVVGGGAPARVYQNAYRSVCEEASSHID